MGKGGSSKERKIECIVMERQGEDSKGRIKCGGGWKRGVKEGI